MRSIESIARLTARFHSLPGVGLKTAERYAYAVISMSAEEAREFSDAILEVKSKIRLCSVCGNFTDREVCSICSTRDKSVICVVKEPKDVTAMEKLKDFKGVYHVLHGVLDPLNNVGPDDIRVKELLKRLDGVKEVIMALNSDANGEATSMYVSRLLKPLGIKVTRLGSGIPANSDIEYADEMTLLRAMTDRKEI
ncbi:MAG: recombination protein RecR [Clostridia bacterium]|nr:recombination protein RecR [Clostridia bacterium]